MQEREEDVIDLPFPMEKKEGGEIYHGSDKLSFVIHDEIRYSVSDVYIYIYKTSPVHSIAFLLFFPPFFFIFDSPNECTKNYWHAIRERERDNKRDERGIVLAGTYIYIYLI